MMHKERVVQALFDVIEQLNRQRPAGDHLEKSEMTVLSGEGGQLDSLGLINLIVAAEEKIENEFHTTIILTDDAVLRTGEGPLRTIGTLADHIAEQLGG